MKRSTQRILTTHAGSFPRPDELLSLLTAATFCRAYASSSTSRCLRQAPMPVTQRDPDSRSDAERNPARACK